MRIAIVGAGAIGGWFAARLATSGPATAGNQISVIARGATLAAIRENGIRLHSADRIITAQLAVTDVAAELGPQDLVIIAVKGPSLASAATSIAPLLGTDTAVLSAMNGIPWWFLQGLPGPLLGHALATVDPDGVIANAIPTERIVGCVVHASCSADAAGVITHKMGNELIIGEPAGTASPRVESIATVLRAAQFDVRVSPRIQTDIWYKLWGNMTMNPVSALTGATADLILDDPLVRQYALSIMREAATIGSLIGCPISESGEDRMAVTRKLGAFKTSMLRDAQANRPLEIDALLAAPRDVGRALNIQTPAMDSLHGLLRVFAAAKSAQSH